MMSRSLHRLEVTVVQLWQTDRDEHRHQSLVSCQPRPLRRRQEEVHLSRHQN